MYSTYDVSMHENNVIRCYVEYLHIAIDAIYGSVVTNRDTLSRINILFILSSKKKEKKHTHTHNFDRSTKLTFLLKF